MATLSLTIARDALELDPLVIGQLATEEVPLWLPEDALQEPAWGFRITSAPESGYFPGQQDLAAVLDASTLPLLVKATGVGGTALRAAKAVLEAATSQWSYNVTLSIDGATQSWLAGPCFPAWGRVDSGEVQGGIATGAVTFRVQPYAGA